MGTKQRERKRERIILRQGNIRELKKRVKKGGEAQMQTRALQQSNYPLENVRLWEAALGGNLRLTR